MKRAHDEISAAVENEGNIGANDTDVKRDAAAAAAHAPATADNSAGGSRRKCPYLDTINRNVLDFDFEKVRTCVHACVHSIGYASSMRCCARDGICLFFVSARNYSYSGMAQLRRCTVPNFIHDRVVLNVHKATTHVQWLGNATVCPW